MNLTDLINVSNQSILGNTSIYEGIIRPSHILCTNPVYNNILIFNIVFLLILYWDIPSDIQKYLKDVKNPFIKRLMDKDFYVYVLLIVNFAYLIMDIIGF